MSACPCNSGKELTRCCEPYLNGETKAPTAEALMRSRYTAFATHNVKYISDTIHPDAREDFDDKAIREWAEGSEWHGLEIKSTEKGGPRDTEGMVEFVARYKTDGTDREHHERATFKKHEGTWYFVDGAIVPHEPYVRSEPKVGRNDPCPCGSGKKHKKCCGKDKPVSAAAVPA